MLFLLVAGPQDPPRSIAERLGSSDPDVRERVTKELIETGPPALAEVRALGGNSDPEVRSRALKIIEEIEGRMRGRVFRPEPRRRTWSLKDAGLRELGRKVFEPFGMAPKVDEFSFPEPRRTATLLLTDATFWQSVDEFKAVIGGRLGDLYNDSLEEWSFVRDWGGEGGEAWTDVGEFRIVASRSFSDLERRYELWAWWPPRQRPAAVRVEGLAFSHALAGAKETEGRVTDVARSKEGEQIPRTAGQIGHARLWKGAYSKDEEAPESTTISGTLVLSWPKGPRLTRLKPDDPVPRRLESKGLSWFEDGDGEWLMDDPGETWPGAAVCRVVAGYDATEEERIPFRIVGLKAAR